MSAARIIRRSTGLLRCSRAATAAEFALLVPAILLLLLGTIECGRLLWTKQTLDEVAYNTARGMAVSGSCSTAAMR